MLHIKTCETHLFSEHTWKFGAVERLTGSHDFSALSENFFNSYAIL